MQAFFAGSTGTYDGSQLRGGWIQETFGLGNDAVVAFVGPCAVASEHMVDLEDLAAGEAIRAREMLHFVCEHPDGDLARAVLRQRLLVACAREALEEVWRVAGLRRDGDDIYLRGAPDRKLSVSVATRSRRGTGLIHLGVNTDPAGAPVPAVGLAELGVDASRFAEEVCSRYVRECEAASHAAEKVREAP